MNRKWILIIILLVMVAMTNNVKKEAKGLCTQGLLRCSSDKDSIEMCNPKTGAWFTLLECNSNEECVKEDNQLICNYVPEEERKQSSIFPFIAIAFVLLALFNKQIIKTIRRRF